MDSIIQLNSETISNEHICCAISDKKCKASYELKKDWLKKEFSNGYVFRRIDARAKVFIEYGPSELGWAPIKAPNYLLINCFWVSGKYKKQGYGKALIQSVIDDAITQNKDGLVTVVGTKKMHFMSDTKWLLKQGFETCATLDYGFSLLVKRLKPNAKLPTFNTSVKTGHCPGNTDIVVYYSNRCPFSEFHALTSLTETVRKRNLSCEVIKLSTMSQAQDSPTPATIFSLFYKQKFVTTDISVCMDTRFDKVMAKAGISL